MQDAVGVVDMKRSLYEYWLGLLALLALLAVLGTALNSTLPLVVAAVVMLAALITWQPLLGLCMVAFYLPQENLAMLFPSFTLIKLIGGLTFWGWFTHLLTGKKVFKMNRMFVPLVLYLIWCLLSIVWAIQPGQSWPRVISLGQMLLMFIAGYNLVDSKKELHLLLGSYVLGAVWAAGLGIYNGYLHAFMVRIDSGGLQDPNFYARIIGLGVLFGAYLAFSFINAAIRRLSLICCVIIVVAVLLSGSRGTWLALLAALSAGIAFAGPRIARRPALKRRLLISLLVVMVSVALFGPRIVDHLPYVVVQRAETLTHITDQTNRAAGRFDIWLVGLEIAKDNLAKGVGINNFPCAFTEYFPAAGGIVRPVGLNRDPHNVYLANLTELGVPGLLLFMLLLWELWRSGDRTENRVDAVLCKLLVIFLATAGLTGTDHFRKFFWFGLLIPCILAQFGVLKGLSGDRDKKKFCFWRPPFPTGTTKTMEFLLSAWFKTSKRWEWTYM